MESTNDDLGRGIAVSSSEVYVVGISFVTLGTPVNPFVVGLEEDISCGS
jgi:hypothetical protein